MKKFSVQLNKSLRYYLSDRFKVSMKEWYEQDVLNKRPVTTFDKYYQGMLKTALALELYQIVVESLKTRACQESCYKSGINDKEFFKEMFNSFDDDLSFEFQFNNLNGYSAKSNIKNVVKFYVESCLSNMTDKKELIKTMNVNMVFLNQSLYKVYSDRKKAIEAF
ncbi:hypothetical protein JE006_23000 [Pseudomonas aeruginosa]|nr:hypothetical protein [Pseudomonas aeruginosa]